MGDNFDVRLLKRSIGAAKRDRSIKTLYGDKTWVEDLDIVNELGAHTGCVNALSWSTSGNFLASGSDDTHLNIWEYNPAGLYNTFSLNTSVSTGHHANIFSVKFMPHSGDRKVVTCAGDSEVRVFDLEYAGTAQAGSVDPRLSTNTRSRRFNTFFRNARWLNEGNTNARVYRSHADRAKRIVTESSPHLFLTCSEDGEVRQWDLRQPSSAYPAPRGGRGLGRMRGGTEEESGDTPPPLISYKKYSLDLNTISCAASQPQYIALGGAHLHCFLHDRRMLGRDIESEKGRPATRKPVVGTYEDEAMAEATRCVRRFAPNNKRKMGLHDHGHITACKISDANPTEMIASWSGDHIYSFDIVKSPDAREADVRQDEAFQATRLRNRSDRKRKRTTKGNASSSSLTESANPSRRLRKVPDEQLEEGHTALLARYSDGASELIRLPTDEAETDTEPAPSHGMLLSEAQTSSERVARSLVRLRKTLFDFSALLNQDTAVAMEISSELTPYTTVLTNALGQCASLLPEMDDIIRTWSYPINPSEEDVMLQNTLRRNRQASWRFIQASGCLARCLGGRLQSASSAPDVRLAQFDMIKPAAHEGRNTNRGSRFCYDFLKAILLWLDGGQKAVLEGFRRPAHISAESPRFPLDKNDTLETFVPRLQAYLMSLADQDAPVIDIDANRFERDESRVVFHDQESAVAAFTRALAGVRLETNQGMSEDLIDPSASTNTVRVMDKGAAARFWGIKVGRSLLLSAATGVTFDFVNRAFGGLRFQVLPHVETEERPQEDIDPEEEEERVVEAIDVVRGTSASETERASGSASESRTVHNMTEGSSHSDVEMSTPPTVHVEDVDKDVDEEDEEEVPDDDHDDNNENDESESDRSDSADDNDDDDDGEFASQQILFRRRTGFGRSRERASVNLHVPYASHSKVYKGHCNTRTVKDVNYYGLDDEYVVSGSDDGHFFIWDRKTSKILNILEGDGEVVNVVQGHPYEPMIACSGIDSTIKVFGPAGDSRERYTAEKGTDVANPGGSVHSSLRFDGRRRRRRHGDEDDSDEDVDAAFSGNGGLESRRAMHREYEITSQNDAERRRGVGDTLVTEGMLARFAMALQRGQIEGVGGQGFGGQGGTIVVDDNCLVM